MTQLIKGDCLDVMSSLADKSKRFVMLLGISRF